MLGAALPANPKVDPAIFHWQYYGNPFGEANCWVYEDEGRFVCHMARLPVAVRIGGRETLGAITVDAATDERYRKRGLFWKLLEAANADCCDQGIEMAMSFRASASMLPKASAQALTPMVHLIMPLDATWVADRLRIPRAAARLFVSKGGRSSEAGMVETRSTTPSDIDPLWALAEGSMSSCIIRDGPWWAWRFDAHPARPYRHFVLRSGGKLRAAAVVRWDRRGGHVVGDVLELMAAAPDAARWVVETIAAEADEAVTLSFLAPRRTAIARMVRQAGFRTIPRRFESNPLSLNLRDICGDRLDLGSLSWHATSADMDHL